MAAERLGERRGSARLVPVVLPLLPGPPRPRRRAPDSPMARHSPSRSGVAARLRVRRSRVPAPSASGAAALGLRQPQTLMRVLVAGATGFIGRALVARLQR